MPLMVTEEEAKRRLNHNDNLVVKHKLIGHSQGKNGGRPKGGKNLSLEFKSLIGTLAKQESPKEVAKVFDMHPQQVRAYENGKTSDGRAPDPKLREVIENNVEVIRAKVLDKVLKSIDAISEDKIAEGSLPILSKAAVNLAGVFDKLGPKDSSGNVTQQQFVFFGVKPRREEEYQVIEVEAVNQ